MFQATSKKKKRSSQKFFRQSPQKKRFPKIFQALHKILTIQKIVLFSNRGQANFRGPWGLEAKAKDVLEDSTSVSKYNRPTEVLVVFLSGMSLYFVSW